MDRKEFLSQIGLGSAAIFTAACMQACSKTSGSGAAVDFTLDLNNSANSALKTAGGYVISQGVIVALTKNNTYIAVSSACPHEGVQVQFNGTQNQFICTAHNSVFTAEGSRVSGPTPRGLTQYKTALSGSSLRVYS